MNKNKEDLIQIISIACCLISLLVSLLMAFFEIDNIHIIFEFGIFIPITILVLNLIFLRRKNARKSSEIQKLNKIVKYSKKRKELEEEIHLLTNELMNSDLPEYIDVNRLAFNGQTNANINEGINYSFFLGQFGILDENIKIKKDSAVFLTEFTKEGEELFIECQRILGAMNIFLRKTDNCVEKEDIMMNIVSLIVKSEIVIVNINGRNPNVYYELGIAHAIGKPTILLSETNFNNDDIGFDIRQKRIIMYDSMNDLEKQLLYQINNLKRK